MMSATARAWSQSEQPTPFERKSEPRAAAKDKQLFRATPGCASKRAQCQRHPDRGTGGGRTLPISATIARIPSSST